MDEHTTKKARENNTETIGLVLVADVFVCEDTMEQHFQHNKNVGTTENNVLLFSSFQQIKF